MIQIILHAAALQYMQLASDNVARHLTILYQLYTEYRKEPR